MRKTILLLLLLPIVFGIFAERCLGDSGVETVIYGRGCLSCFADYVESLRRSLAEVGVTDIKVEYLEGNPRASSELDGLFRSLNVPPELRGSVVVALNGKFLFEDYVPIPVILDFVTNHMADEDSIVVYRDALTGSYRVIVDQGEVRECTMNVSISECLGCVSKPRVSVLPIVVIGGFLDGINPCAFSVLLFFVAFLVGAATSSSSEQVRREVLRVGSIYLAGVFSAYLLIGLALFRVISTLPFRHLAAEFGSILLIVVGFVTIAECLRGTRGVTAGIRELGWMRAREWMRRMSILTTFISGLIIGVFEFPCTGGIYLSIIGLLASRPDFLTGLSYLLLYNGAFITPLAIVLAVASNKKILTFSMKAWQRRGERPLRLLSGVLFVLLGVIILLSWVI